MYRPARPPPSAAVLRMAPAPHSLLASYSESTSFHFRTVFLGASDSCCRSHLRPRSHREQPLPQLSSAWGPLMWLFLTCEEGDRVEGSGGRGEGERERKAVGRELFSHSAGRRGMGGACRIPCQLCQYSLLPCRRARTVVRRPLKRG
jgi:hypothetical protein